MTNKYLIYDIECYPDIWTCSVYDCATCEFYRFEISSRNNDIELFRRSVKHWSHNEYICVGFNNVGYDYPVVHAILTDWSVRDHVDIYKISNRIICTPWVARFTNQIPEWKREIKQLDLFLINHFDNAAKSTSLKMIEFVSRSQCIEDLPFPPGKSIGESNFETLHSYNKHDVAETYKFFVKCLDAVKFRLELSHRYNRDFTNYNDTRIGKEVFTMKLEQSGVVMFNRIEGQKVPIQTLHNEICLNDVIFPFIKFERPEFNQVLNSLRNTVITNTKGSMSLTATINGFDYDFGLGGLHGSVEGCVVSADENECIEDVDFASWYPHISFKNGVHPEHLPPMFCTIYEALYNERAGYEKGTSLNKALKLALNGVYGDSNSEYSAFFDSKYTMTITINGQLMLCMLAEQLLKIPGLKMIQVNTDGLTVKYPRTYRSHMNDVRKYISQLFSIKLESVMYSKMAIRDVNNYIAMIEDSGKLKMNGAYDYIDLEPHKNHSMLVVRKAAVNAILYRENTLHFILNHEDPFDFYLCAKVKTPSKLILTYTSKWGNTTVRENVTKSKLQGITRYCITIDGHYMYKVLPPLCRKKGSLIEMKKTNISKFVFYENEFKKAVQGGFSPVDGGGYNRLPNGEARVKTHKIRMIYADVGFDKTVTAFNMTDYNDFIDRGYRPCDSGCYYRTGSRFQAVNKGYKVTPCNNLPESGRANARLDYNFYAVEADKLVNAVNQRTL